MQIRESYFGALQKLARIFRSLIYMWMTDTQGGNFDLILEFKRMTTDIEAGKVNCVIVKDLSRLGREYIEAGRWIEKTYPALNVRFISVTDQFDSKTADFSEKSFVVPIKNFVNESYCRDISDKVRSHQKIKRERGEFIEAFAP